MIKNSKQRDATIEILQATDVHPTAEWIYERLRERFPNVSLATVYRNLKKLKDMGLVKELYTGDSSRFDANMSEHYHFVCKKCGRVTDVFPKGAMYDASVMEEQGFKVDDYELSMYGFCPQCNV